MKCFYHSADLDGHCSGAIVQRRFGHEDCELIGINYGDAFPWDRIETGELVYMVDFSLQPFMDMLRLHQLARLVWIDHHKSAIEEADVHRDYVPHPDGIEGLREIGRAGCELTWQFLYPRSISPLAVDLLGRYDVWDLKNPAVLAFQYGMRMFKTFPNDEASTALWDDLLSTDLKTQSNLVNGIVKDGTTILSYIKSDNEKYCRSSSFVTELDGLKCIAINKLMTNSQLFDSVWDKQEYHAMLTFGIRKGKWTVSLYSDREDVDVSAICKARGGGGHKGAAGFQCDILPFKC